MKSKKKKVKKGKYNSSIEKYVIDTDTYFIKEDQ